MAELLDLRLDRAGIRSPVPRIMVVHPDPLTRALLNDVLADLSANVEVCEDGEAALRVLQRRTFDLVITSEWLPGMSGRVLVEQCLRGDTPTPIIVLDTEGPCGEVHDGGPRGAVRISCPFSPRVLIDVCGAMLARATAPT